MDITSFRKDPAKVLKNIEVDEENFLLIAKAPVQIMVPEHYFNGKLGSIGERYMVTGIFAVIAGTNYCTSLVNAQMPLTPDDVNTVVIEDSRYYVFSWEAGGVICPNTRLPQNPALVYEIYDEVIAKGKMPWYIKRRERAELLYTAPRFAGVNLGDEHELQSIFAASCDRDHTDLSKHARTYFKSQDDYDTYPCSYIPLRSVAMGTDNTTAKMLGAYLESGVTSALVNPTDTAEDVESLLRA